MSDAFWANLPVTIVAVGTLCTTLIGLWNSWKVSRLSDKVEVVHKATNSMKDQLVRVTGESEFAKGKLEGEAERVAKRDAEQG
jgi:hypothetical protein